MKMKTSIIVIIIAAIGLIVGIFLQSYLQDENKSKNNNFNQNATSSEEIVIDIENSLGDVLNIKQDRDLETGKRIPSQYACVGEYCDGSMYGDDHEEIFTVIQVPLVKDGGQIGCGADIFFAPHAIPKTQKVLEATYRMLFDIKHGPEIPADGFRNTVAAFEKTFFDKVTLEDRIAKVYLTGEMMSPGVCADPEFRAQIEAAAFQFDSVKEIQVFLNNERFDWCTLDLSDGEGFCKAGPQYWITIK